MISRRHALVAPGGAGPTGRTAVAGFASRPITLAPPFGPGGIADLTARAVAQAMTPALGQAVVVDRGGRAGKDAEPVVQLLNQKIALIVADPALQKKLRELGGVAPTTNNTAGAFAEVINRELASVAHAAEGIGLQLG